MKKFFLKWLHYNPLRPFPLRSSLRQQKQRARQPSHSAIALTTLCFFTALCFLVFFLSSIANAAFNTRIKDVVRLSGVKENVFIGYGLVVGLAGTGDRNSENTIKSMQSFLKKQGITLENNRANLRNTAMVMVSAKAGGFLSRGDTIDVEVASMGDSRSIENGLLLPTSLRSGNYTIYITANGVVKTSDNHPTRGTIIGGGIIERDFNENNLSLLHNRTILVFQVNDYFPDYSSSIKTALEENFENYSIALLDEKRFSLEKKDGSIFTAQEILELLALEVELSPPAKIVLDMNTGVMVMGDDVRINTVFISLPNTNINLQNLSLPRGGGSFTDSSSLMEELQRSGASIEEIAAVFSALKKSGAINAEVVFQ